MIIDSVVMGTEKPLFNYSNSYSRRDLQNIINGDPTLVWLDRNVEKHDYSKDSDTFNFGFHIKDKSEMMEKHVVAHFEERFPGEVYSISSPRSMSKDDLQEQVRLTQEAIKLEKGIILNPTLFDPITKIYGTTSFIVRFSLINQYYDLSDLNSLLPQRFPDEGYVITISKFWNCSPKKSAEDMLGNRISSSNHKNKLLSYLPLQRSLNPTLNDNMHFILVLPRKPISIHTQSATGVYSFHLFNSDDYMKIKEKTTWMHDSLPGILTDFLGSSPYLAPNMKNRDNYLWGDSKKRIAEELGELTLLSGLGKEKRDILWNEYGIRSIRQLADYYKDDKSILDDVKLSKRWKTQLIPLLSANSTPTLTSNYFSFSYPEKLKTDKSEWTSKSTLEFFVDFETFASENDDFSNFPHIEGCPMIFMIGCSELIDDKWQFSCFIAEEENHPSEKTMIDNFFEHIRDRTNNFTLDYRLYHWHSHEPREMKKAAERHGQPQWETLTWFDLLVSFRSCGISVRNAFNYSLKSIGKSLYDLQKVKCMWPKTGVFDGLNACVAAWESYRLKKEGKIESVLDEESMQQVREYNRIDCEIMGEILIWMRSTLLSTSAQI